MKPCIGKDNKYNPQKTIILQTFLVSWFISKIKEIVVLSHILFLFYYWCRPRMVFSFLSVEGIPSLPRLPPSEIQMLRLKAKFKNNRLAYLFSSCCSCLVFLVFLVMLLVLLTWQPDTRALKPMFFFNELYIWTSIILHSYVCWHSPF
jgi:hypothetical protein